MTLRLRIGTQTEGNLSAAKQCLYKIRLSDTPNISDSEKITVALSGGAVIIFLTLLRRHYREMAKNR